MVNKNIIFLIFTVLTFTFTIIPFSILVTVSQEEVSNLTPSVIISDQKMVDQTVYVDQVISSGQGWIAIHKDNGDGGPGPVIGNTLVKHGINTAIKVELSEIPTGIYYAMLHIDNGSIGIYEFPGVDAPVFVKGEILVKPFSILDDFIPYIVIEDQPVVDSVINVNFIVSNESNAWIVIHLTNSDISLLNTIGKSIGMSPLTLGLNTNVKVSIENISSDISILIAIIYFDKEVVGKFESSVDLPIKLNGQSVLENFGLKKALITQSEKKSTDTKSFLFSPVVLHIIFSVISAFIIFLVGFINLSRNYRNKLNQVFFGFYSFIGIYQMFDSILLILGTDTGLAVANFVRDIMISSLILSLLFVLIGVSIIYLGENFVFNPKIIRPYILFSSITLLMGILGDREVIGDIAGYGSNIGPLREILGWISIAGLFLLSLAILIPILGSLIFNEQTSKELKNKLTRLLVGLVLVIVFLFLFDISFAFQEIQNGFISSFVIHTLMHLSIVLGALLILSTYITSFNSNK